MLEELFKKGYLNYEKMILENTKALGVTIEEAVILICILKENSLSVDKLQNNLLITFDKVDKILSSLMERGFYAIYLSYDNGRGTECVSFEPLFEKLEAIINKNNQEVDDYDIAKANSFLSEKMNRVLTSQELEILQSLMLEDRYSYDEIVTGVNSILENKRALTMRTLTAKLADKSVVMPKKEGNKELKDFFNKI